LTKRLRVFAGPNGSGKSTVQARVAVNYDMGYFVNADNIESQLRRHNQILFSDFGVTISPQQFRQALVKSGFNEKQNLAVLALCRQGSRLV